jgi:hypothetical protein
MRQHKPFIKLHNTLSNEDCIGKQISAQIDTNRDWVDYEDSDKEKDHYRSVAVGGRCVYMDGETCEIRDYDEVAETVTLYSDEASGIDDDYPDTFTIPYEQYVADFGIDWHDLSAYSVPSNLRGTLCFIDGEWVEV